MYSAAAHARWTGKLSKDLCCMYTKLSNAGERCDVSGWVGQAPCTHFLTDMMYMEAIFPLHAHWLKACIGVSPSLDRHYSLGLSLGRDFSLSLPSHRPPFSPRNSAASPFCPFSLSPSLLSRDLLNQSDRSSFCAVSHMSKILRGLVAVGNELCMCILFCAYKH